VPIGWIDTGVEPTSRRAWLGGDVLAPGLLYEELAAGRTISSDVPVDGATVEDLVRAIGSARSG
jgi:hypothetical protein